jgi:hypothetical protein
MYSDAAQRENGSGDESEGRGAEEGGRTREELEEEARLVGLVEGQQRRQACRTGPRGVSLP